MKVLFILEQFSIREGEILLPKDYVAVSGDILGGCNWGRGAAGI